MSLLTFVAMNDRIKSLLTYIGKCVTGTLIVFTISHLIHYEDMSWALISVLLVLSPDGKDSVSLAVTRIKANIVGAAIGVLCLLIAPANMWSISLSLAITLAACYALKLDAGIRSALAASVIVMLHVTGKHLWDSALERVIAVLAGCLLGLIITFIFHFKVRNERRAADEQNE